MPDLEARVAELEARLDRIERNVELPPACSTCGRDFDWWNNAQAFMPSCDCRL